MTIKIFTITSIFVASLSLSHQLYGQSPADAPFRISLEKSTDMAKLSYPQVNQITPLFTTNAKNEKELSWKEPNTNESLYITLDKSYRIIKLSNHFSANSSSKQMNTNLVSVSQEQAVSTLLEANRTAQVPAGDWRIVESALYMPPDQKVASTNPPEWKVRQRRFINQYLSWNEQIYSTINPFDNSLIYWSYQDRDLIPISPLSPNISEDYAQRVAESVLQIPVRRVDFPLDNNNRQNGPFFIKISPNSTYTRLYYLFYPTQIPQGYPRSFFTRIDATTGEVDFMRFNMVTQVATLKSSGV